jgi:hypothetical protein
MIDRKELETLIAMARAAGATVTVNHDGEGCIESVQVAGLKGVGPYPMTPIAFGERMREVEWRLYPRKAPSPEVSSF